METFKKAHFSGVEKTAKMNKKSTKTIKAHKKQIKKMLFGYKTSNIGIIKDAANIKSDDDEDSISNFSDLDVTQSIHENYTLDSKEKHNTNSHESQDEDKDMSLIIHSVNKKKRKKRNSKYLIVKNTSRALSTSSSEDSIIVDDDNKFDSELDSLSESSSHISVSGTDIPISSFSEMFGAYRYPVIKKLPYHRKYNFDLNDLFTDMDVDITDIYANNETNDEIQHESFKTMVSDELQDDSTLLERQNIESIVQHEVLSDDESIEENKLNKYNEEIEELPLNPIIQTVNSIKSYNHNKKRKCVLIMKHPSQIYVHGKVRIKVLGGAIEVGGYTVKDNVCDVFAPNCHCAQYIKTVETLEVSTGLFAKLTGVGLSVADAEEIVTTISPKDAVVSFYYLKNTKLEFVETNFIAADLFTKQSKKVDKMLKESSDRLQCSLYISKSQKCFEEDSNWKPILKFGLNFELTNKKCALLFSENCSRGIVCGGKGVGKSTFLRYYVNKRLAQGPVVVIDLDPGQCEFTVPGNISVNLVTTPLLGPNFTHLRTPELMLNLAMINPMNNYVQINNLIRYAAAVHTLIAHCHADKRLQNLPWIVNTMGLCNSTGLQLMSLIILLIKPTFLLQVDSQDVKRNFKVKLDTETILKMYSKSYQNDELFKGVDDKDLSEYAFFLSNTESGNAKRNSSVAPKDERYLNILSYFAEVASLETGLLAVTPYVVNIKDVAIGLHIPLGSNQCHILKVINRKILAMCQQTSDKQIGVFELGEKALLCHGHGFVVDIDEVKGLCHIITPVTIDKLCLVDTLVYADWMPELRCYERYLKDCKPVPYHTTMSFEHRHLMTAPRRRFNPLMLLKLSRKP